MKSVLAVLALFGSVQAFGSPLEAVDCKREMLAEALAKHAKTSTLKALLSSSFEVTNFDNLDADSGYGNFDYVVTIVATSGIDQTTMTASYAAKVTNLKKCSVATKMLTD